MRVRDDALKLTTSDHSAYVEAERTVRSVYQPIVELGSRRVVAWEALARGPKGSARTASIWKRMSGEAFKRNHRRPSALIAVQD